MKPIPTSVTLSTKPGVARVTSTPAALAAGTSMVLISTATRRKATRSGAAAKVSALPGVARSATIAWQPRAASASAAPVSTVVPGLRTTSACSCSAASARSP